MYVKVYYTASKSDSLWVKEIQQCGINRRIKMKLKRKNSKLPGIVTIVLYNGINNWTAPEPELLENI